MKSVDHLSSYSGDHNVEKERDNIENTLEIATEVGLKTFNVFMI